MQSSLLKEIQSARQHQAHNQFFLVTHSPFLVPPETITKVSRFFWQQGKTASVRLNAAQLDDQQMGALEKELRRSSDVRSMLFSSAVILFEGETELGALPVWFEKQFGYSLESRVVALYSAGGEQGFQTYVRFLNQFHIPWALICDGPIIANDTGGGLAHQLRKAGVPKIPDVQALSFEERCKELKPLGIFTLASDEDGEFEALPIIKAHQEEAKRLFGRSKVRQGRYIAEMYDCPDEVKDLLQQLAEYLKLEKAARK